MNDLPARDLRDNLGTWAVPACAVPAVAHALTACLPVELFDPTFHGQDLTTTYFDTPGFDLRKARNRGDRYLTLRIRAYQPSNTYALSAKTEAAKFRLALDAATAEFLLAGHLGLGLEALLPGDLLARLGDLTHGATLLPVAAVGFRRYAVEDDVDRLTLDTDVHTDAGKPLWTNVLEFKSTRPDAVPPPAVAALDLKPMKLSKFLWATRA
jgi:hypothetical protein